MLMRGRQIFTLLCVLSITAAALPNTAKAGVHWREADAFPGCFALAFDDTDAWLLNPKGVEIKRGVCHAGHQIAYRVLIAPGGNSFITRDGTQTCHFSVNASDGVSERCDGGRPSNPTN